MKQDGQQKYALRHSSLYICVESVNRLTPHKKNYPCWNELDSNVTFLSELYGGTTLYIALRKLKDLASQIHCVMMNTTLQVKLCEREFYCAHSYANQLILDFVKVVV
jgi:hypothetical protein